MSRYQIFDGFVDMIVVFDKDGRIVYGNAATALLFDVSPRRLESGKPYSQFIRFNPDPIAEAGDLDQVDVTQIREVEFEIVNTGRKGTLQFFFQKQPSYFAEDENSQNRWIAYLRDVSLEMVLHEKYRAEFAQKESVIRDLQDARAALEKYSQELEKRVAERTAELQDLNILQKTILDSLGQGILVFEASGKCLPVYSAVCRKLIGADPAGQQIEDLLLLKGSEKESFIGWRNIVFDGVLDFEDVAQLGNAWFKHPEGLEVALAYYPMYSQNGSVAGVVVVLTDRTQEMRAIRKAEMEKLLVTKVTRISRNRDAFRVFVLESRDVISKMTEQVGSASGFGGLEIVLRQLHTIKGGASSFGLADLAKACHNVEDKVKTLKASPDAANEIRKLFDEETPRIISALDEEIESLTQLLGKMDFSAGRRVEISTDVLMQWSQALSHSPGAPMVLEIAEKIRQESSERKIQDIMGDPGPSLMDMAKSKGKNLAKFEIVGGETRVPIGYGEALVGSLIHAFRNSIVHGLEEPELRVKNGKSSGGNIEIHFAKAMLEGGSWLEIDIRDDGRGIDPNLIRKKLISKGLESIANESDEQVIQAILRDDFSTAEQVSMEAGRGVGMAAIADEVRKLNGTIWILSEPKKGMTIQIRVPFAKKAISHQAA